MMTIYDFNELFTDPSFQKVQIWSLKKEETVYVGMLDEASLGEFGDYTIKSIDTLFEPSNTLTINIA